MTTGTVASKPRPEDHWTTRAGEWTLFALAWSFRLLTWPIPTKTLGRVLAPVGGALVFLIPAYRRRAEENLTLIWPEMPADDKRHLVRDAARHFTYLMIEYARLDKVAREVDVRTSGIEHLVNAERGAVIVSAHFGNWEAIRLAARTAGVECGIIYRAFNNRYLDRFTMNLIPIAGTPVMQKGKSGSRQLITHVARGGTAMILVDQRNSGAPFIDFLGKPAETVTAAADLARRTGAALIPARAIRDLERGGFDVVFEDPVPVGTAEEMMSNVNARIGAWVEETPEQWFWFHRRWRTTARSRNAKRLRPPNRRAKQQGGRGRE